jgi:hypothetical protein
MTRLDLDPDLARLGEALQASTTIDLARQERAARPDRRPRRRSRIFAGGTLGLVGIGVALVLVLSAGGATAPPAFAITHNADGTVLVKFNTVTDAHHGYLYAVNHMLVQRYHEEILVDYAPGPATTPGAVSCTPTRDADAGLPKTPVDVLLGANGTAVIPSGTTGAGTVHLADCSLYIVVPSSSAGNTGAEHPAG